MPLPPILNAHVTLHNSWWSSHPAVVANSDYIAEVMPTPWLPVSQKVHQKGKTPVPDSSQTRMQNFMPLPFSAAEKSVTIQTKKQTNTQ